MRLRTCTVADSDPGGCQKSASTGHRNRLPLVNSPRSANGCVFQTAAGGSEAIIIAG